MRSESLDTDPFRVGNFVVQPSINSVLLGDEASRLEPRVMEVLCLLAEEPGRVVLRETLIDRLWKVEHGADESVTRAISVLRKTFRQGGDDITYIETLPKRGYRLVAPVEKLPATPAGTNHVPQPDVGQPADSPPALRAPLLQSTVFRAGTVACGLLLVIFVFLIFRSDEQPEVIAEAGTEDKASIEQQLLSLGAPADEPAAEEVAGGDSARKISREQAAYRMMQEDPETAVILVREGPEAGLVSLKVRAQTTIGTSLQEWLNFAELTAESHPDLSLEAFRIASEIDPENHAVWIRLSNLEEAQSGDLDAARAAASKAEQTAGTLRDRLVALERIAILEAEAGDTLTANKRFEQIVTLIRQQLSADEDNAMWLSDLSIALDGLGTTQMQLGDIDAARQTFSEVLALDRERSKSDPNDWDNMRDITISLANLGELELSTGNHDAAKPAFEESLAIAQRNYRGRPDSQMMMHDLILLTSKVSEVNFAVGDAEGALAMSREAEQLTRLGLAKNPDALFLQERLLDSLKNSAKAYLALGNSDEALRQFEGALEIGEALSRNGTLVARMQPGLEEVLQGLTALSDETAYQEQRDRLTALDVVDAN